jgi:hypothetical protein
MRLNFFQWFENLKTQAKLLTVFALVGVIIAAMAGVGIVTNGRLSTQAETMYADYTIALTDFNQLLFNLNRYHESLVDVSRTPRASDFEIELKDIAPYRTEIERLVAGYESRAHRTSSSGRDEAKDLAELKAALATSSINPTLRSTRSRRVSKTSPCPRLRPWPCANWALWPSPSA